MRSAKQAGPFDWWREALIMELRSLARSWEHLYSFIGKSVEILECLILRLCNHLETSTFFTE